MKHESGPVRDEASSEGGRIEFVARDRRYRHRFAAMVLATAGLHVPLTPLGKKVFELVADVSEAQGFENTNMVLRPQTNEDKQAVLRKIEERAERIDRDGLQKKKVDYQRQTTKEFQQGKPKSFRRMYFDLERLNGVSPEDVALAEQNAEKMIMHFVEEMNGHFDSFFVKKVVGEMYDS